MFACATGCAELFEEYWRWCFGCPVGVDDEYSAPEELEWHVECSELLSIPHADSPNVIIRALPHVMYETLDHDAFRHGASILCLTASVLPNQMLKRDLIPKKRSKNRIARLLTLIGDKPERWAHASERVGLLQMNNCSSPAPGGKFEVAKPIPEKADIRPLAAMTEFAPTTRRVFSDYPAVHRYLTHPSFERTPEFDNCDILFAVNPVASFNSLGRRLVNQFPRESAFICPRRLLHAVRSVHHGQGDPSSDSVVIEMGGCPLELFPSWFPLSFDLKTELKLFLEIHQQLDDPMWMLISGEAGSFDWCLTSKTTTIVKHLEANEGDWIVQKLIRSPLLSGGCKVMMSMFLLVCAFDPIDAHLYKKVFGTVAADPFSLNVEFLADDLVQLPFEDPTAETKALSHEQFVALLLSEGVDWDELLEKMTSIVKELLVSVQRQIGTSQRSRAVYRLDFNLPSVQKGIDFQPQLAKVAFAPDFRIPTEFNPEFVNQVFSVLFSNDSIPDLFLPINDGLESGTDLSDAMESI